MHCADQRESERVLVTHRIKCVSDTGYERAPPISLKASLLCLTPLHPLRAPADTEGPCYLSEPHRLSISQTQAALVILAFGW